MLSKKSQKVSSVTDGMLETTLTEISLPNATAIRVNEHDQNEVYRVTWKGNTYFLKLFSDVLADPDAGINELEAIKILKGHGLPVPEVLHFYKGKPRNYALYSALRGTSLMPQDVQSHTPQCVDLLERLSKITSQRFGYIHPNPEAFREYASYEEYLNDVLRLALRRLNEEHNTRSMENLLGELFEKGRAKRDFVFCHNDLNPRHTFWEGGSLTGLIDFEWSFFGGPIVDAASWVVALREMGARAEDIKPYLTYMIEKSQSQDVAKFYLARRFLISASWPNKRLEKDVVKREFVRLSRQIIYAPTEEALEQVFMKESDD